MCYNDFIYAYLYKEFVKFSFVLQEAGHISIGDVSNRFALPISFLSSVVEERLGTCIHGVINEDTVYTPAYVARQNACIRGLFAAITRSTPLVVLLKENTLDERLFFNVLDELLRSKRVAGEVSLVYKTKNAIF